MILHAKQRWPEAISANLWPFAIRFANEVMNEAPASNDDQSPIEKFSSVNVSTKLSQLHTFGSPVYVLDAKLQQGKRIQKWTNRSRVGVYLGPSPRHSRKVALVLSLTTGHVSPQFHCQFDDLFDTRRKSSGNPNIPSQWQGKTGFINADATPDYKIDDRHNDNDEATRTYSTNHLPDPSELWQDVANESSSVASMNQRSTEETELPDVDANLRRSTRPHVRTERMQQAIDDGALNFTSLYVPWDVFHDQSLDEQERMEDPIAFAASSNPDILHYGEAMKAHDREHFETAMDIEVTAHTDNGHWQLMKRADLPAGQQVLPSVWAFRRKRRIATNEVYKWKARLNIHGGKQTYGLNYWET